MVICLELGADLHMAQLMPLPLTVSCFSKIQIGFTSVVPAHLGSPGKRAVKRVCVCFLTFIVQSYSQCVASFHPCVIIHGSLSLQELAPQMASRLVWLFCRVHCCVQQTEKHMDRRMQDVCSSRPHVCSACSLA